MKSLRRARSRSPLLRQAASALIGAEAAGAAAGGGTSFLTAFYNFWTLPNVAIFSFLTIGAAGGGLVLRYQLAEASTSGQVTPSALFQAFPNPPLPSPPPPAPPSPPPTPPLPPPPPPPTMQHLNAKTAPDCYDAPFLTLTGGTPERILYVLANALMNVTDVDGAIALTGNGADYLQTDAGFTGVVVIDGDTNEIRIGPTNSPPAAPLAPPPPPPEIPPPVGITATVDLDFRVAILNSGVITFSTAYSTDGTGTTTFGSGTVMGTGSSLDNTNGFSATTTSYLSLDLGPAQFEFTQDFSMEFYFKSEYTADPDLYHNPIFIAWNGGANIGNAGTGFVSMEREWNRPQPMFFTTLNMYSSDGGTIPPSAPASDQKRADSAHNGFNGAYGHIVVTHSSTDTNGANEGGGKWIYVDGQPVNAASGPNIDPTITAGLRQTYHVGGMNAWNDNRGTDSIRFIRFYNRVLTRDEVAILYADRDTVLASPPSGPPPPSPPPPTNCQEALANGATTGTITMADGSQLYCNMDLFNGEDGAWTLIAKVSDSTRTQVAQGTAVDYTDNSKVLNAADWVPIRDTLKNNGGRVLVVPENPTNGYGGGPSAPAMYFDEASTAGLFNDTVANCRKWDDFTDLTRNNWALASQDSDCDTLTQTEYDTFGGRHDANYQLGTYHQLRLHMASNTASNKGFQYRICNDAALALDDTNCPVRTTSFYWVTSGGYNIRVYVQPGAAVSRRRKLSERATPTPRADLRQVVTFDEDKTIALGTAAVKGNSNPQLLILRHDGTASRSLCSDPPPSSPPVSPPPPQPSTPPQHPPSLPPPSPFSPGMFPKRVDWESGPAQDDASKGRVRVFSRADAASMGGVDLMDDTTGVAIVRRDLGAATMARVVRTAEHLPLRHGIPFTLYFKISPTFRDGATSWQAVCPIRRSYRIDEPDSPTEDRSDPLENCDGHGFRFYSVSGNIDVMPPGWIPGAAVVGSEVSYSTAVTYKYRYLAGALDAWELLADDTVLASGAGFWQSARGVPLDESLFFVFILERGPVSNCPMFENIEVESVFDDLTDVGFTQSSLFSIDESVSNSFGGSSVTPTADNATTTLRVDSGGGTSCRLVDAVDIHQNFTTTIYFQAGVQKSDNVESTFSVAFVPLANASTEGAQLERFEFYSPPSTDTSVNYARVYHYDTQHSGVSGFGAQIVGHQSRHADEDPGHPGFLKADVFGVRLTHDGRLSLLWNGRVLFTSPFTRQSSDFPMRLGIYPEDSVGASGFDTMTTMVIEREAVAPPPSPPPPPAEPSQPPSAPPAPPPPPEPPLPPPPPAVQADCHGLPTANASYLLRSCLTYVDSENEEHALLGYVPDIYNYNNVPTVGEGRRLTSNTLPIAIVILDTGMTARSSPAAYTLVKELGERGYCAFVVDYFKSATDAEYCLGGFASKASSIFGTGSGSAVSKIEQNLDFCNADVGLAAVGIGQGAHIALLARQHDLRMGAMLLFSSAAIPTISSHRDCLIGTGDLDALLSVNHKSFSPVELVRSVAGEQDAIFMGNYGMKDSQRLMLGLANEQCKSTSSYEPNCLVYPTGAPANVGGYGYYVVSNAEAGSTAGHNWIFDAADNSLGFSAAFLSPGVMDYTLCSNLNWASRSATTRYIYEGFAREKSC